MWSTINSVIHRADAAFCHFIARLVRVFLKIAKKKLGPLQHRLNKGRKKISRLSFIILLFVIVCNRCADISSEFKLCEKLLLFIEISKKNSEYMKRYNRDFSLPEDR